MRTVTFSDAALAAELNAKFACAWVNKKPSEKFEYFRQVTDKECRSLYPGAGAANVTSIFATPEGRVLDAFPGYLAPDAFRAEMELAGEVHRWGFEDYEGLHRARAEAYLPKKAPAKTSPSDESALPVGARAHRKLARAGFLRIEDVTYTYFDDFAPRMQSLRVQCGVKR